jgi:hypothetical protein
MTARWSINYRNGCASAPLRWRFNRNSWPRMPSKDFL